MRKIISISLIISILLYSWSCMQTKKVSRNNIVNRETIVSLVMTNGTKIEFNEQGASYYDEFKEVRGINIATHKFEGIKIDSVLYANCQRVDAAKTAVATIGTIAVIGGVLFIIIAATKQSCPFIYSWDGQKYVFEAEPLGGAICKALQRSDKSRLNLLKPYNGKYKIKMSNEVNEVQYIDKFHLEYIDIPSNSEIMVNLKNEYFAVDNIIKPTSATDGKAQNIMPFFEEDDGIIWQTKMPQDDRQSFDSLWHDIDLKFIKPSGDKKIKIVYKGGTSLWGSQMVRTVTELYGKAVQDWYRSLYTQEAIYLRTKYMEHDNLYLLDVLVKEDAHYVKRGVLPFGGPFQHETRLINIDLSSHIGDTVEIKLKPPKGYWAFDFIGLTSSYSKADSKMLLPLEAIDDEDYCINALDNILFADSSYLVLPEVGDGVNISFDSPIIRTGYKRTVFAVTDGYYEMKLNAEGEPNMNELYNMSIQPGEAIRFALKKYNEKYQYYSGAGK